MTTISRREFIRRVAASAGGLTGAWLLQACGQSPAVSPTPSPEAAARAAATATFPPASVPATAAAQAAAPSQLAASPVPAASATPGIPDLVVARGGEPEALVKSALAALGGIERFVKPGNKVIVKPNMCVAYHTYEFAATTNPWVVGSLVKLCLDAGAAKVSVMDYPFGGTAQEAYQVSGIQKEVEAAGGSMVFMPGYKYKTVSLPNAKSLKKTDIFDDILTADVLIDVPVAKSHSAATLTLAMKNLMGIVKNREDMHVSLHDRIADLANFIRPKLTVIDAVRVMIIGGPTGGSLDYVKKMDTLIAGTDIVAADAYATTSLFDLKPSDVGYITKAAALGLGKADLSAVKIQEIAVAA